VLFKTKLRSKRVADEAESRVKPSCRPQAEAWRLSCLWADRGC
jgi:hypothetical protein